MKNLLFSLMLIAGFSASSFAQADNYGAFEWDIVRFGYVIPTGDGVSGGLAISSEPRFNLRDDISVSLRYEIAIFGSEDGDNVDIGASASYALFGDYYFATDKKARAFAGLGIGNFAGGSTTTTVNGNEVEVDGGTSFGIVPRIGYELGFLRLSGEYNLAFDDAVSNYIGVHLGFTIGGKYKG